ncbi:hypothetical protein D918_00551 [Trichuris suis]|nr:hypothetical protein D918_00551 [Trichuris suis]
MIRAADAASKEESKATESLDNITVDQANSLQNQLKQLQAEQILGTPAALFADRKADHIGMVSQAIQNLKEVCSTKRPQTKQQPATDSAQRKMTLDVYAAPDGAQSHLTAKAALLESRLSNLEKLVGSDKEKQASTLSILMLCRRSSEPTLPEDPSRLRTKVALLDNSQLDVLEARLNALAEKLAFIADKKQSINAAEMEKVKEAFDGNSEQIINNVSAFQKRLAALEEQG